MYKVSWSDYNPTLTGYTTYVEYFNSYVEAVKFANKIEPFSITDACLVTWRNGKIAFPRYRK